MGSFGAPSAKPSKGWTNNKRFALINRGPYKHDDSKAKLKTVTKTISKTSGKVSVTGTPALKETQFPGFEFGGAKQSHEKMIGEFVYTYRRSNQYNSIYPICSVHG